MSIPRLYFLFVNFKSISDSCSSTLSPLLSSFCQVSTLRCLGCTKLTRGLLYGVLTRVLGLLGLLLGISGMSCEGMTFPASLLASNPTLCGKSFMGSFSYGFWPCTFWGGAFSNVLLLWGYM